MDWKYWHLLSFKFEIFEKSNSNLEISMPILDVATSEFVETSNDESLIGRIVAAYIKAMDTPISGTNSVWLDGYLVDSRQRVHDQLMGTVEGAKSLLRDPGKSDLLYGFEDNCVSQTVAMNAISTESLLATCYECIYRLAEAIGCIRIRKPEILTPAPEINDLLERLDDALGFRVEFPNPYPGETGLKTDRGIVTYRAAHAIYQAWRLKRYVEGISNPSVVEIGAGSGRTGYYARKLGILDYTIVDLPLTCVASANFLGRTLGEDALKLYGEESSSDLKIVPPEAFFQSDKLFDVFLNVDSLTEMAKETAAAYVDHANRRSNRFISINHEMNYFTVKELIGSVPSIRFLYWLRPGYVEEVIETQRGGYGRPGK
jgi:hypothetical protein